jgi:hypothetical protein
MIYRFKDFAVLIDRIESIRVVKRSRASHHKDKQREIQIMMTAGGYESILCSIQEAEGALASYAAMGNPQPTSQPDETVVDPTAVAAILHYSDSAELSRLVYVMKSGISFEKSTSYATARGILDKYTINLQRETALRHLRQGGTTP